MRYMTLKNVKIGMQMAKPLIDENGNILLKAGNQVSSTIYNRIQQMELQGLYVHDEVSDGIEVEDLIRYNLKSDALKALLNKNIKQSITLAKEIVEDLRGSASSKVNLIDIKNNKNFPQKHCVSVCVYSVIIGMAMKLTVEQLNNLAVAAMLHDIAKFDLPDSLLYKPAPLSPAEEKMMQMLMSSGACTIPNQEELMKNVSELMGTFQPPSSTATPSAPEVSTPSAPEVKSEPVAPEDIPEKPLLRQEGPKVNMPGAPTF